MPASENAEPSVDISIIVPTYNEGSNIKGVLTQIIDNLKVLGRNWEIVVIDDSSDSTYDILREIASADRNIRIIHRKKERGFGSAIRTGLEHSKGRVVLVMMGDDSDDPKFIGNFLAKIDEGYDMVVGSRFMKGSQISDYPFVKYVANRSFNWVAALLFNLKTNDLSTSFKAYRRSVVERIKPESNSFEVSPEFALKAIKSGFKYCQIPVTWRGREFGEAKFKVQSSGLLYFKLIIRLFRQYYLSPR